VAVVIRSTRRREVADADLERLLWESYVGGGFTEPERAATAFAAAAVRARGDVLCAWGDDADAPLGMVIVVHPGSPACRFARAGEAEMQLLATDPAARGAGVGRALVGAAMDRAAVAGAGLMVLWTQTTMDAAQRLYAGAGFRRVPARDFEERGRRFLFFAADLR
jgi:ribosomal protein S18 acetylase RimI-like enzyme